MKRELITAAVFLFAVPSFAVDFRRAEATLGDVHAASCRVRVTNARGSGWFALATGSTAYVITNQHVVENNTTAKLDFWTNGVMETVDGRVVWRKRDENANVDFAVIEVDANALKRIDPPYIPIAPVDSQTLAGACVSSSGGPDGRFVQAWLGKVEKVESGMAIFSPPPVPGQSGSCVVFVDPQDKKPYVGGIVTYLLGTKGADESKGGALPMANFAAALGRASTRYFANAEYVKTPVAAPNYSVLAFTSPNCPACVPLEPALTRAEKTYSVKRVDGLTESGATYATAYGVTEMPTYLILDGDGNEAARLDVKTLKSKGADVAIKDAIDELRKGSTTPQVDDDFTLDLTITAPSTPANNVSGGEPGSSSPKPGVAPSRPPVDEKEGEKYKIGAQNGVVVFSEDAPPKTMTVFITDPATYRLPTATVDEGASEVSADFFKAWRERGDAGGLYEGAPATPIAPRGEEKKNDGWALGDKFAERLEKRLDSKLDDIKGKAKEEARSTWRRWRWRVYFAAFAIVVAAVLSANWIVGAIKGAFGYVKRVFKVLADANRAAAEVVRAARDGDDAQEKKTQTKKRSS